MSTAAHVPYLLRLRAAEHPDLTALVVDGGPSLTYRGWRQRSEAVAAGLRDRGVAPGDRVLLHFDGNGWADYAVCYLGVLTCGAVAVPTSPRFSDDELAGIVDDAGVTLVVSPSPPSIAGGPPVVDPRGLEQPAAAGSSPPDVPDDALAEIVYTSGTTGRPKGVACSHASLLAYDLPEAAPDRSVAFAHAFPIGTNAGQECLRMPLRRPATAVVLPTFDPERLCELVAERRIARLQLVPATAEMLVSSGAAGRHDVSSVEGIVLSSAPAPPALWSRLAEAFPGATLFNAYALTESGSARTLMRYDPQRPRAVGRPVGRTEVRIVDDDKRTVPPGETGEIQLRRPGAPRREYHGDPEATAAAYDGDWLRTGDLGFLDDDGCLHLVDRSKDLIIRGGLNISSVAVQDALHEHPAVRDAAAFGVPHPVLGEEVAAAVVLRSPASERDLQATVRDRLGEHQVPRRIEVVDELPRNPSGKIDKRQLRDRLAPRRTAAPAEPRDDVEATVLAVWREVLGRDDIGIHDDFFELGGHSLAAAGIVARLEDAFATDLPVTVVFERPTVAELAEAVAAARVAAG